MLPICLAVTTIIAQDNLAPTTFVHVPPLPYIQSRPMPWWMLCGAFLAQHKLIPRERLHEPRYRREPYALAVAPEIVRVCGRDGGKGGRVIRGQEQHL